MFDMSWAFLRRITSTPELKVPYSLQQQFAGLFACICFDVE
jgi:hypothetical protein